MRINSWAEVYVLRSAPRWWTITPLTLRSRFNCSRVTWGAAVSMSICPHCKRGYLRSPPPLHPRSFCRKVSPHCTPRMASHTRCRIHVGPAFATLAQRKPGIGSAPFSCLPQSVFTEKSFTNIFHLDKPDKKLWRVSRAGCSATDQSRQRGRVPRGVRGGPGGRVNQRPRGGGAM